MVKYSARGGSFHQRRKPGDEQEGPAIGSYTEVARQEPRAPRGVYPLPYTGLAHCTRVSRPPKTHSLARNIHSTLSIHSSFINK